MTIWEPPPLYDDEFNQSPKTDQQFWATIAIAIMGVIVVAVIIIAVLSRGDGFTERCHKAGGTAIEGTCIRNVDIIQNP